MSFRPSIHGWPFGRVGGMESHTLGLGAPPAGGMGLGGGLCWSALDRYLRGVGIPRQLVRPEPGNALYAELIRRQVAALAGVWSRTAEWQAYPDGSWRDRLSVPLPGRRDLASLTRAQWPRIRSTLHSGRPILLTLLHRADAYRRGHAARQLLATDWRQDDRRIVLSVYDPDRPGDDNVRLSFMPAGPLDARLNDGSEVRGFWATPYDRVPPASVRVETFGDRSVIGLNRVVDGRPAAVAGRRRIDLVARNNGRALLHFRRSRDGSWEGANITERDGLGAHELHGDPMIVRSLGLHVFARNYVGDLLHFRPGRTWRVINRSKHARTGPAFRLTGQPVALSGPWGLISVLGLDGDGGLIHYTGQPVLGWRAHHVPGETLSGDPVGAWVDSVLHVIGTTADGRLLHRAWDGRRWTETEPSSLRSPDGTARVVGRPVLGTAGGFVHVAGRSDRDRLLVLRRTHAGDWETTELGATIIGDPVLTTGPAGIHVFARAPAGGITHAWRDDAWCQEELSATRSSLAGLPPTAALACWGSRAELRVWGRADDDLWCLVWRADADWTLESLADRPGVGDRHRPGDGPMVVENSAARPHLFFTDGRGTVLHVEPAEWREPAPNDPVAAAGRVVPSPGTGRRPAPGPEPDRRPEPTTVSGSGPEPDPGSKPEPEPTRDPGPDGRPTRDGEPSERPRRSGSWAQADARDFRWTPDPANGPSPRELEPIDLSLVDGWPSPPPTPPGADEEEKGDGVDVEEEDREKDQAWPES